MSKLIFIHVDQWRINVNNITSILEDSSPNQNGDYIKEIDIYSNGSHITLRGQKAIDFLKYFEDLIQMDYITIMN